MDHEEIAELLDREAIRDCLYRYCRAVDRADEAALRSSYWPDAHDSHGVYSGSAEGFIELALGVFKTKPRNIHQITKRSERVHRPGKGRRRELLYGSATRTGKGQENTSVSPLPSLLRPVSEEGRGVAIRRARRQHPR